MWTLQPSGDLAKRHKEFEGKFKRELSAVYDNLDTYLGALNEGARPLQIKFGFVHAEGMGVVAVDQKGGGKFLKETRLYIFPDSKTQVVHVLTLGDKRTQKNDIKQCHQFVEELRKSHEQDSQKCPGHGPVPVSNKGASRKPEESGSSPGSGQKADGGSGG